MQRRLETWIANLTDDVEERALGVVRRDYEDVCHAMAEGFTKALAKAGWTLSGPLHQTRVWSEIVAPSPRPVAYFLMDAMRFEMGVELLERLPRSSEVSLRAAISALPSITPVGMAALQPGASGSFSVVEQGGVWARRSTRASCRTTPLERSTRRRACRCSSTLMDTVIDNLARAIRKLANAGVEHAVLAADHGHLFHAVGHDESMRIEESKGQSVDLHRRCWVGRGGATPAGCVRVSAAALGYASDLEMVFPAGAGVFKSGGGLAFHHGGPSLQEMVIPVLQVYTKGKEPAKSSGATISAEEPKEVTNRIFSVRFVYGERQLRLGAETIVVRPLLIANEKQVGAAEMSDGEIDRATGCVTLAPNKPVTVYFLVTEEKVASLRVVV